MKERPSSIRIVRFRQEHARKASYLVCRTMRVSNAADYPPEDIEDMCRLFSPARIRHKAQKGEMYLAKSGDRIVGITRYYQESIASFFVHPNFQRQGIGSRLLAKVEERARQNGDTSIAVLSSFTSVSYYRSHGFRVSRGKKWQSPYWVRMSKRLA